MTLLAKLQARRSEGLIANAAHLKAMARATAEEAAKLESDAEVWRLSGDDAKAAELTTKAIQTAIHAENLRELAKRMEVQSLNEVALSGSQTANT